VVIGGFVYTDSTASLLWDLYFGDFSKKFSEPNGSLSSRPHSRGKMWSIKELRIATTASDVSAHSCDPLDRVLIRVYVLTSQTLGLRAIQARFLR